MWKESEIKPRLKYNHNDGIWVIKYTSNSLTGIKMKMTNITISINQSMHSRKLNQQYLYLSGIAVYLYLPFIETSENLVEKNHITHFHINDSESK